MYINPFAIYIVFFIYELCYVNQKLELTIVDKAGGFAMFTGDKSKKLTPASLNIV